MNISKLRPANITIARNIAERHNITASLYAEIYTAIIDVLKKFDGKEISKRIETALKADPRLSPFSLSYHILAGMYQITFWGNGLAYEERNTVFLGYTSEHILNLENVMESNRGFLHCTLISMGTFDARIIKWNKMVTDLRDYYLNECDDISYILSRDW